MKNLLFITFIIYLTSCNEVDFVYKNEQNLVNPLYQKTEVSTSGLKINFISSYMPMFFGDNKEDVYDLLINIEEKKTKRSVETNQTVSNLRYELKFIYTLIYKNEDCITYEKELVSNFSIIPKSSGYNYGTDSSLETKYELAITDNLNRFVSILSEVDVNSCA